MEVEKEIEFLREEVKSVKRQVYDNKDAITTLSIETKMFEVTMNKLEVSISKLVDKLDTYITKQNEEEKNEAKEKLTNYEKVIWFLKTLALSSFATLMITVVIEYLMAFKG